MTPSTHSSASPGVEAVRSPDLGRVTSKRPLTATDSTTDAENRRKDPKETRTPRPLVDSNTTDRGYVVSTASAPLTREISQHPHNDPTSQALQEIEIEDQYFDPTSGLNFLHRAWRKLSTQKGDGASYGFHETDKRQLLASAGDRPFKVDRNVFDASGFVCVPQESTLRKLLEFYFETCVVTYRMLHRPTIEAWMDAFVKDRRDGQPIGCSLGHAKSAILLAIMAIATLRYEKVHGDKSSQNEAVALGQSDQLYCMSTNLTETETGFPRLESVQGRLLQVLYLLQTSRMNKGWYTFGNTCNITLSLGMHRRRDCQRDVSFASRRLGYISLQCYKRTFWVAYTIDKYLSVVFGRPRLYQDEDIDQDFPESVNDEDMTPQCLSLSEDSGDCHIDSLILHARYVSADMALRVRS
ncbi:hypothetical protein N7509_009916 [Penicillium cosmopolitanum]|uniref:Xylanolytic transcriptional activator regulatory domain-containing protein n=1 Tax=Penicillium cosmopolitanum TaxID=1131564 RepID=A0A9W9VQG6_9EURO|nr:uncharacterized protein N7509_009916 [Penicillium cosmopolitanum]KAJ5387375.1 hypothetical protein N7509_009916 [Penicillium cosmopolitanum]